MSEGILKLGRYLGLVSMGKSIDLSRVVFYLAGFLITRSNPGGIEIPIAAAWYIIGSVTGRSKIVLAMITILGTLTAFNPLLSLTTIVTIIIFEIIQGYLPKISEPVYLFSCSFISIAIPSLIATFLNGGYAYDVIVCILKDVSAVWVLAIFQKAFEVFEYKNLLKNNTELFPAFAITFILTVSGIVDVNLFSMSSIHILLLSATLFCAFYWGPGAGCSAGLIAILFMEDISSLGSINSLIPVFCGLFSGFYRSKNKFATSFVFIFTYLLLSSYIGNFGNGTGNLAEIIISIILFIIIPTDFIFKKNILPIAIENEANLASPLQAVKIAASEKLTSFSKALSEVSKIIEGVDSIVIEKEKDSLNNLFDNVADRICKDCSLCLHCWEKSFYSTYQAMHSIVEKLEKKGWVEDEDLPGYFLERCERTGEFMRTVNSMYEIHKLNTLWKNKLEEGRMAMSKQFSEISSLIAKLSEDIDTGIYTRGDMEGKINLSLKKAGFKIGEVTVAQQGEDHYTISLCYEENNNTSIMSDILLEIVTEYAGRDMDFTYKEKTSSQFFRSRIYKFNPRPKYSVSTGVVSMSKQVADVSGDTYSLFDDENGKYFVILSDGSGTGAQAATYSKTAIGLTENMIEAGFENSTSVRLINSAMLFKSMGEIVSTIDIAAIDLYKPIVEFFKIGAAPSFIKRNNFVEYIPSKPINLGSSDFLAEDIFTKELEDGDTIIMMSDGAYERLRNRGKDLKGLQELIKSFNNRNPQELAELLMDVAYDGCKGSINDDMTIMATKIWKRTSIRNLI
jgi:stage II sporulation protein E